MAETGFIAGSFTGGGTFLMEDGGGTRLASVGLNAWGGAGTITRVGPTMAAALPVGIYGGTVVATAAGTQLVSGTVALNGGTFNAGTVTATIANTGTVVGTVATSNAGTLAMLQAGTISQQLAGTLDMVKAGTVDKLASGTLTTLNMLQAGTVSLVSQQAAGTLDMLKAGTVHVTSGTLVATAAGTQLVSGTVAVSGGTIGMAIGAGKTLTWGTINLTSGSVSLVNPGTGTRAYLVGIHLQCGTSGVLQFLQGVGANALTGPMPTDQYGGFVNWSVPASPILQSAAGSQIYLSITSGIGTAGGYYSYFTEA